MTAARCAALARAALCAEVDATPKPGLVDRENNGAHRDMDRAAFLRSAAALEPYFAELFTLGAQQGVRAMPALRACGRAAERAMYHVTGGANTHKGALFTLGLLCAARGAGAQTADGLCAFSARLSEGLTDELAQADTAGGRLFRQTGRTGARGEAAAGLPSVRHIALPALSARLAAGESENDAAVYALLALIAGADDSNLFSRGGEEGARWAREQASACLARFSIPAVRALDRAFIARNLSPGGSADLLAAALFLRALAREED